MNVPVQMRAQGNVAGTQASRRWPIAGGSPLCNEKMDSRFHGNDGLATDLCPSDETSDTPLSRLESLAQETVKRRWIPVFTGMTDGLSVHHLAGIRNSSNRRFLTPRRVGR